MNLKILASCLILGISLFNIGCSHKELTKYVDDKGCLATIEGNYYKGASSIVEPPNIF